MKKRLKIYMYCISVQLLYFSWEKLQLGTASEAAFIYTTDEKLTLLTTFSMCFLLSLMWLLIKYYCPALALSCDNMKAIQIRNSFVKDEGFS